MTSSDTCRSAGKGRVELRIGERHDRREEGCAVYQLRRVARGEWCIATVGAESACDLRLHV